MGRTFACSDLHGNYEVAKKIFDYLKEDDTLYFLGDAIDRGDRGIEILQTLFTRPNTYCILGNHEEMMLEACAEGYFGEATQLWFMNGGGTTAKQFNKLSIEEKKFILSGIGKMPEQMEYASPAGHKVILEHAGYSPFYLAPRKHSPLWDRKHIMDPWCDKGKEEEAKNVYIVHGHTPVQYFRFEYQYADKEPLTDYEKEHKSTWSNNTDFKPTVIHYCGNNKINIDMCTIASHRGVLLDLDTFEEIYFDVE